MAVNNVPGQETPLAKVVFLLAIGLLTFGLAPILVRFAPDVEPLLLAAMRTGFAVLFLLPFWFRKKASLEELKLNGAGPLLMIAAGISLGLHFTLWVASIQYTSVASASVLVTIHPVMLIVAESLLYKKKFRLQAWIGVIIAFSGSLLLGIADNSQAGQFPHALLGNTLAFSAAVIFVIYFLLGRQIRQNTEWIDYVFYVYLYAAVTCVILTLLWVGGVPSVTITAVVIGIALAIGPTLLGHGSMNYAVKYISPTLLSTLVLSEAVIAAIGAYFLFGEVPSKVSLGSMIIIIIGVGLSWSKQIGRIKPQL